MIEKIASAGKILARIIDNELEITNRVSSKLDQQFIDSWQEFDSEQQAREYFGIDYAENI